jgi:hypothetical protein
VYVDASNNCNTAAFQLGQTAIGTTIPSRAWNIKVNKLQILFLQIYKQIQTNSLKIRLL